MRIGRVFIQIREGTLMALGSLRSNKLRFLLTVLGIMIGVATVIAILTIISGLNSAFSQQISGLGSDNLYVTKLPWAAGMDYFKYRTRKNITGRELDAVVQHAIMLSAVAPVAKTRSPVKFANRTLNRITINGTNEQYKDVANAFPEYGRFMTVLEVEHRRNVCVLGWEVAEKLFESENPVGEKIQVGGSPFHVIGILEKQGQILGNNLDSQIYMPLGAFQKTFGYRRSLMLRVKVDRLELIDMAKDELRGILRRVRNVPPGEEDDFAINQQDLLAQLYKGLTSGLYGVSPSASVLSLFWWEESAS